MSNQFKYFVGVLMLLFLSSCKSEFEKIRTSGDVDLMYGKAQEFYKNEEWYKAQTVYELLIGPYRGKKELERIYYNYANTYYELENYVLASFYFTNFANTFGNSTLRQDAEYKSALSHYNLVPAYRLDQSEGVKAIEAFQLFINTYPESPLVQDANQRIDELRRKMEVKAIANADLYYDLKQYQAAVVSYEILLKEYPETTNATDIRYNIVRASYEMAINSVFGKRERRLKDAIKKAEKFISRYKGTDKEKEVLLILENSNKRLKEFIDGRYKKQI